MRYTENRQNRREEEAMVVLKANRGEVKKHFCLSLTCIYFLLSFVCLAASPEFTSTEIHRAGAPVCGMDWGDFDPCHSGSEVACLIADGSVLQLSPAATGWDSFPRHSGNMDMTMTDRPTIDIGDIYSGDPGNEVIIEGTGTDISSTINVVFCDVNNDWRSGVLYDSNGLSGGGWGVRVGDFDSRYPGDEIFYIYEGVLDTSNGYSYRMLGEYYYEQERIYSAQVGMDSGIGDFDPFHPGQEIVIVTEMGPVYEVSGQYYGDWSWIQTSLFSTGMENAGWSVEVADVDNDSNNLDEIVFGTRYSNRIMMAKYDPNIGRHRRKALFTGNAASNPKNMWDVAVGNILGTPDKLEIMGVDDTGSVYLVDYNGVSWQGRTIWQDTNGLYAVVVGDFLPDWGNDEILVAGESGRVTMLSIEFKGDFTADGKVDSKDFAEMANSWFSSDAQIDVAPWPDGDGIVNLSELRFIADEWLEGVD